MCPKRPKRRLGNVPAYDFRRGLFSFDIWHSIFRSDKFKRSIVWLEMNAGPLYICIFQTQQDLHFFAEFS